MDSDVDKEKKEICYAQSLRNVLQVTENPKVLCVYAVCSIREYQCNLAGSCLMIYSWFTACFVPPHAFKKQTEKPQNKPQWK